MITVKNEIKNSAKKCINCEYARQAGNKLEYSVVGCAKFTLTDNVHHSFTGKQYHKGYWHTCRVQDLENTGSFVYGILVDAEESCCLHEPIT
jgi:hypothetical protein